MKLKKQYLMAKQKWTEIATKGTFKTDCGFCKENYDENKHYIKCNNCELAKRANEGCCDICFNDINLLEVHLSAIKEKPFNIIPIKKRKDFAKKFIKYLIELFPEFSENKA